MYVDEIILEGFKTYMNRTVISNFDPQFNAITGLNGSGKSNILDAIQFLLGSTSKQMLRLKAGLTELIYKEGFAGIQKASVTIKFKCVDKGMRPTGYENCDELVVTRQITKDKITKFFVNGISSNLTKVRNLFRSVQLNIQNPHFLVKQGQITKIINLKPLELLGMIEQTAGTAYYNKTKQQSEKIIKKKEEKLASINDILTTSIKPQMQKLDADRRRYTAFKEKEAVLSHLNVQLREYEYFVKQKQMKKKQMELRALEDGQQVKKMTFASNAERIVEIDKEIKAAVIKGGNGIVKNYNDLKILLNEKDKQRNHIKSRLATIQNQSLNLKKQYQEQNTSLSSKQAEVQWQQSQIIQIDTQKQQIQSLLQDYGQKKDVHQMREKQIQTQSKIIDQTKKQIDIMEGKRQTLRREMENQKRQEKENAQNNDNLINNLKELENQIENMSKMAPPAAVDDPQLSSAPYKELQAQKRKILSQYYQLSFIFNPPSTNFDRSKVKGKIFMLFSAKQKIHEKALQIGAGGKLHNVVVQNEYISKQMIEGECLGRNVTVIPNNKIRSKDIPHQTIEEAARIASSVGGIAKPAYQLITYDPEISNSIKYVFGNFLICSSPQIAKRIAYHSNRSFSCKCVTYDGDVYESGTLTGGYSNNQIMILQQWAILKEIQGKMENQKRKIQHGRKQYDEYLKRLQEYKAAMKEIDNKINRKERIKQRIMNISLNVKKRDYSQEIEAIDNRLQILRQQVKEHTSKLQSLKSNENLSFAEQKNQLSTQLNKYASKLSETKKIISRLQVQIQQLKVHAKHTADMDADLQQQMIKLEKQERDLQSYIRERQVQLQRLESQKRRYQKQIAISEGRIKILHSEINDLKSAQQKLERDLSTYESQKSSINKELADLNKFVDQLLLTCPWINRDSVIQISNAFSYEAAMKQYHLTEVQVDKLKKSAKMNIDDHSYQKLNQQYQNLQSKRATLQKDKTTLLTNMHDLDEKRIITLKKCFESVKANLSKIFNDLLPGATAHLNLINERDVTEGAELQVQFNKVKKELGELSGGQRSLLALSFILALLLYKPSPFYILDQIDSALDLSHTENIGYMISQRFPQSQFILISLKEGMFQNANVLYRVQFTEGESKVQRQALKKK